MEAMAADAASAPQDSRQPLKKEPSCCSTTLSSQSTFSQEASSVREDTSDSCLSDMSEPEVNVPKIAAKIAFEDGKAAAASPSRIASAALWLLHRFILTACIVSTRTLLAVRSLLACFVSGTPPHRQLHRPKARLSWELLNNAPDPAEAVKNALPAPPDFPEPPPDGITISFGPCANLMLYLGGVAACLQRCPNYAAVAPRLRFYGASCGAFVAASMAADCDILAMVPDMVSWTARYRGRLWGMIGAYSASIAAIARGLFTDVGRFARTRGRLGISVTAFQPGPTQVKVCDFASAEDLICCLLGSCYIPVAFEEPQWSSSLGPLWDGAILEFATQGDVVVSPYEACLPDVVPAEPYPRSFTLFPPHERDAVQIFEDGYMDCLRWLQAGAPTHCAERQEMSSTSSGFKPLLDESWRFLSDLVKGWRCQLVQGPAKAHSE
mmetsp:Transcript_120566/g.336393  ORF Transcript_120566/g.336393 Transcript_120566/m.336393 type:complete len:438 (-) Transcript_120566:116-1429(-)|eukprot:CAMPEP_0179067276 /NCGR_PEP_ID=MMETSP0796-20121207/29407_1 /TAXON_ID=73915 /ORGANISM="Pyrodinium bahamense, Strain pbaha01" /LENGTH=437 /DNA_ID=CAMNT_0020764303 /DNA_START=62 /DNA_END=1375 /DNA_ORIENTATION=-